MSRRFIAASLVALILGSVAIFVGTDDGTRSRVLGIQMTPEPTQKPARLRFPERRVNKLVTMRLRHPRAGSADAYELGLSRLVPRPVGRLRRPGRVRASFFVQRRLRTPKPTRQLSTPLPTVNPLATPSSTTAPAGGGTAFTDDFTTYPPALPWPDGSTQGSWTSRYNGFGLTAVTVDGSNVLEEAPAVSRATDETHASLVTSVTSFGNIDLRARVRTVAHLRSGTPNPWEVAWLVWAYSGEGAFYYFIPKPNGWELGKADATRINPSGPACVWPSYTNCKYAGAQRFLATGTSPSYPVGPWLDVRIVQQTATISVTVNGVPVVTFTDTDNVYRSGQVGLYNEDARVRFDSVTVTPV